MRSILWLFRFHFSSSSSSSLANVIRIYNGVQQKSLTFGYRTYVNWKCQLIHSNVAAMALGTVHIGDVPVLRSVHPIVIFIWKDTITQ